MSVKIKILYNLTNIFVLRSHFDPLKKAEWLLRRDIISILSSFSSVLTSYYMFSSSDISQAFLIIMIMNKNNT